MTRAYRDNQARLETAPTGKWAWLQTAPTGKAFRNFADCFLQAGRAHSRKTEKAERFRELGVYVFVE